ncbi:MAG: hypothetical protein K6T83_17115 [Alicyclobacillus sp.]|nr:hypothetical protein [Alicyclobacillus sp.]
MDLMDLSSRSVEQGHGTIINISVKHETMCRRGFVTYGPSRVGAESPSYIMAEDLLPRGNRIGMLPEEMKAQLKMPLLRPEVMAAPIVWLASDKSDGITGERMRRRVNGMKISRESLTDSAPMQGFRHSLCKLHMVYVPFHKY